jgi:hypothetical protein
MCALVCANDNDRAVANCCAACVGVLLLTSARAGTATRQAGPDRCSAVQLNRLPGSTCSSPAAGCTSNHAGHAGSTRQRGCTGAGKTGSQAAQSKARAAVVTSAVSITAVGTRSSCIVDQRLDRVTGNGATQLERCVHHGQRAV